MQPSFELVDHTADLGIRGRAPDLGQLFVQMALGLFSVIGEPGSVQPALTRDLRLRAAGAAELLHEWLEELNSLHQIHGEMYGHFEVEVTHAGTALRAQVAGERFDPQRHAAHLEVKAVTWHELSVRATDEGFVAFVLLDI
jgi:SHS2 domain-containing protein